MLTRNAVLREAYVFILTRFDIYIYIYLIKRRDFSRTLKKKHKKKTVHNFHIMSSSEKKVLTRCAMRHALRHKAAKTYGI